MPPIRFWFSSSLAVRKKQMTNLQAHVKCRYHDSCRECVHFKDLNWCKCCLLQTPPICLLYTTLSTIDIICGMASHPSIKYLQSATTVMIYCEFGCLYFTLCSIHAYRKWNAARMKLLSVIKQGCRWMMVHWFFRIFKHYKGGSWAKQLICSGRKPRSLGIKQTQQNHQKEKTQNMSIFLVWDVSDSQ